MSPHADKNSPRALLRSGVFSPELLLDCCNSLLHFSFLSLALGWQRPIDGCVTRPGGNGLRGSCCTLTGWGGDAARVLLSCLGVTPKKPRLPQAGPQLAPGSLEARSVCDQFFTCYTTC